MMLRIILIIAVVIVLLAENNVTGFTLSLSLSSSSSLKATVSETTPLKPQQATTTSGGSSYNEERVNQGTLINEEERLLASTFAISPPDLIELTKRALRLDIGLSDESILSTDFEFCAPVVGPIGKDEYLNALRAFDLQSAFPDIDTRVSNIHVDPFEYDRVWFQNRPIATHTGSLFGKKPTGKRLELPPQMNSLRFTEDGLIKEMTVGYVMDRRYGNTGGLGGAFGFFYGVGQPLPIPECKPYRRSWQFRLLNFVGRLFTRNKKE